MATKYTTQEEYQAQMLGAPSEAERDYGLGGDALSPASPLETTQQAPEAPGQAQESRSKASLRGYSSVPDTGGPFGGLFAPVKNTLASVSKDLDAEQGKFDAAAGPRRDFTGIGGPGILDAAFQETATPDDVSKARGLMSSEYQGPLGFDQASVENLRESLYGAKEDAQAAQGAEGASFFTGLAYPGMTTGEKRAEGIRDVKTPEYKQSVRDLSSQVDQGLSGLQQRERAASAFAAGRKQDEEAIAKAAQGIATDRQAGALGAIDARVAAMAAEDQALQDAYDRFVASGSLADLEAIPGDQGEIIRQSQDYQDATASQGLFDSVMAKFSDLQDVPLMERQISTHGKAILGFPKEWYEANKGRYTPAQMASLKERAIDRQRELEEAGFSAESRGGVGGKGVLATDPGQYAAFNPLYGDIEGVAPQDLRSYFGLDIGTGANRQNQATDQERFTANRAAEILGQLEMIDENTTPYEASRIAGEGQTYLDDLAKAIAEKRVEITGDRDDALRDIKKARKAYRKAVRQKHYNVAARVLVGTGTMGFSEVPVGGKPASERFAGRPLADSGTVVGL